MVWALDKAKQYGWFALKLLTLIIAVWLIIRTLSPIAANSWAALWQHLSTATPLALVLIGSLSLANWTLEIIKWQTVVKPLEAIDFFRATRETLLAFSIGFITPLKLGEYAVKTQFYADIHKEKILVFHLYCHLSQLICTVFFGLVGLLYFDSTTKLLEFDFAWIILMVGGGLFIFLLYVRFQKHINTLFELPGQTLLKILFLSVLRFMIFSSMLALGFHIMGSPLSWSQAIFGIWTLYLIQVIAPTFSMVDIAIKSGGALLVFHELIPAPIIMGAILLQYFLSQILPLIFGLTVNPTTIKTP